MYVFMCVCMYVRTYVCMYVCTYVFLADLHGFRLNHIHIPQPYVQHVQYPHHKAQGLPVPVQLRVHRRKNIHHILSLFHISHPSPLLSFLPLVVLLILSLADFLVEIIVVTHGSFLSHLGLKLFELLGCPLFMYFT